MCRLTIYPFSYENDNFPPRTLPRLAWTIPVDIVTLGTSLEAYLSLEKQVHTLVLTHRFRQSPLSRLPQEILERVIDELQQLERDRHHEHWSDEHACFQERCEPEKHYKPDSIYTKDLFEYLVLDMHLFDDINEPFDLTTEEQARQVQNHIRLCPDVWKRDRYELHDNIKDDWLDRTCLCENKQAGVGNFVRLNNLLKTHFGLEAIIFHEIVGSRLCSFLPDVNIDQVDGYYSYNTVAYLVLATSHDIEDSDESQQFLVGNYKTMTENQFVYRQVIDPSTLHLSETQQLQFARAMRVLGLKPYYSITDLQKDISPAIKDDFLMDICACDKCPRGQQISTSTKIHELRKYLAKKNKELVHQSWPRLMILCPSQAVEPTS